MADEFCLKASLWPLIKEEFIQGSGFLIKLLLPCWNKLLREHCHTGSQSITHEQRGNNERWRYKNSFVLPCSLMILSAACIKLELPPPVVCLRQQVKLHSLHPCLFRLIYITRHRRNLGRHLCEMLS